MGAPDGRSATSACGGEAAEDASGCVLGAAEDASGVSSDEDTLLPRELCDDEPLRERDRRLLLLASFSAGRRRLLPCSPAAVPATAAAAVGSGMRRGSAPARAAALVAHVPRVLAARSGPAPLHARL